MKAIYRILVMLMCIVLVSCSDEDLKTDGGDMPLSGTEYKSIKFKILQPLTELPSSRSIKDASKIHDYTIWVFNNDKFIEVVTPSTKYIDTKGEEKYRIEYDMTDGGIMKIALNIDFSAVRLLMLANVNAPAPAAGTSLTEALETLQNTKLFYDLAFQGLDTTPEAFMPMFGGSTPSVFNVKIAVDGVIQLQRCLAKVSVLAFGALDHFKLERMFVFNVNKEGFIAPSATVTNRPTLDPMTYIQGVVDPATNSGYVYLPEITGISEQTDLMKRTCVIIRGQYSFKGEAPKTKYFRLEFIERQSESGTVEYREINTLRRNHNYIFDIDYLIKGVGFDSALEAINHVAANRINKSGQIKIINIEDEGIMDITTDNYIYLGVTSSHITTVLNTDKTYYAANFRVITNNDEGWTIDALPSNIEIGRAHV